MLQFLPALLLLLVQSQAPVDSLDARMHEGFWARVSATLGAAAQLRELRHECPAAASAASGAEGARVQLQPAGSPVGSRPHPALAQECLLACACPRDGPSRAA